MKILGFNFGSEKPTIQTPLIEKIDNNIYAINAFQFSSDNTFLPSYYNNISMANGYIRYGEDNLFPNRLADLYYSSPLHQTAIKLKSKLICGDGVELEREDSKANLFIDNITGYDSVDKLITDITYDYKVFGAYHLLITWNSDFTKIVKLERLPTFGVRYAIDATYKITSVYYTQDWLYKKNQITNYPLFNVLDKTNKQQVYIVKNTSIDNRIYAIPDYASGLNAIAANAGISTYQLSVVENGFNPVWLLSFIRNHQVQKKEIRLFLVSKKNTVVKRMLPR